MSHSAEKCKRALDLLTTYILLQIFKKTRRGTLWDIKNFQKCRTVPKKIQKGYPLGTSGFVGFLEKVKTKGGTL